MSQYKALNSAIRKNQAYNDYIGPDVKITAPITYDLPADAVTVRRAWFPSIKISSWFQSPLFMTKEYNMRRSTEIGLTNREKYSSTRRPGQISQSGVYQNMNYKKPQLYQSVTNSVPNNIFYLLFIIIGIGFVMSQLG